ncbi:MAG TPA: helix-turn-helix domain-containing protein [Gemmatimonadales bacterium]|nr:helix-turn-helix domain-containing protein [Gemmatimonadales bacterium]
MTESPVGSLLGAVIEAIGEGVVVFDRDGRLAYANQSARAAVPGWLDATGSGPDLMTRLLEQGGRRVPLRVGQYVLGEAVFLESPGEGTLADLERRAILEALQHTGGRLADAARHLGISRTTLWRRLREYGVGTVRGSERR